MTRERSAADRPQLPRADSRFGLGPVQEQAIEARLSALQLSVAQAAYLANACAANDPLSILRVLGLDISTLQPLAPRPWADMAARTCSVSYRGRLPTDVLRAMLLRGETVDQWCPHLGYLLDEAPLSLLVLAIEETSQYHNAPINLLWHNLGRLAVSCHSRRLAGWPALVDPGQ